MYVRKHTPFLISSVAPASISCQLIMRMVSDVTLFMYFFCFLQSSNKLINFTHRDVHNPLGVFILK